MSVGTAVGAKVGMSVPSEPGRTYCHGNVGAIDLPNVGYHVGSSVDSPVGKSVGEREETRVGKSVGVLVS